MSILVDKLSQIAAVTALNVRNIPQRLASSIVALVGITGVVTVLVGVLSIRDGFRAVLELSGAADVAIVLRNGATDEMGSNMSLEQSRIIADAPGVARDAQGVVTSPELYVVVDVPLRSTGTSANVPLRGVGQSAAQLRQDFRIVQGRDFVPGNFEVIVGSGAARQFAGLDVGRKIRWGTTEWLIAGIFEDRGSVAQSEIWTDASVLQGVYNRGTSVQSMRVKLTSAADFGAFKDALTADPRLNVTIITEQEYYARQAETMTALVNGIGKTIAVLMGLGAIFAALNTMYSSVATRTREIATLRALGFNSGPVMISVLTEALLLGLLGGVVGMLIAYFAFDGVRASTMNFATFSQITFAFNVTPALLVNALIYALVLGLIGGSLPCWRAARLPITSGLREL